MTPDQKQAAKRLYLKEFPKAGSLDIFESTFKPGHICVDQKGRCKIRRYTPSRIEEEMGRPLTDKYETAKAIFRRKWCTCANGGDLHVEDSICSQDAVFVWCQVCRDKKGTLGRDIEAEEPTPTTLEQAAGQIYEEQRLCNCGLDLRTGKHAGPIVSQSACSDDFVVSCPCGQDSMTVPRYKAEALLQVTTKGTHLTMDELRPENMMPQPAPEVTFLSMDDMVTANHFFLREKHCDCKSETASYSAGESGVRVTCRDCGLALDVLWGQIKLERESTTLTITPEEAQITWDHPSAGPETYEHGKPVSCLQNIKPYSPRPVIACHNYLEEWE